ncbi:MAG: hypothetical protein KKH72_15120 [Alphaproteobacteria bacterium]|nr:hypothetical protein [Alphaproteobacteria bacterium]
MVSGAPAIARLGTMPNGTELDNVNTQGEAGLLSRLQRQNTMNFPLRKALDGLESGAQGSMFAKSSLCEAG